MNHLLAPELLSSLPTLPDAVLPPLPHPPYLTCKYPDPPHPSPLDTMTPAA